MLTENIRKKLLRLQEEKDEVTRLDKQNRRHMANLRTKVKQMNDEISRNGDKKCKDSCTTVIMVLMMIPIRLNHLELYKRRKMQRDAAKFCECW
jgi:hypothetical protein